MTAGPPPGPVPTPSSEPFLSIVACGPQDPKDVIVPEPVAVVLEAKGWIPPEKAIVFDDYATQRMATAIYEYNGLPAPHATCWELAEHALAALREGHP